LQYPDGSAQVTQIGKSGSGVDYPQLPRGLYTLRLKVAGLGAPTPVALSRDQTAVIRVITYLDLGILGILLLGAIGAMAWFGRRHQLISLGHSIRARSAAAVGANRALLGNIADLGSRRYRDRRRFMAVSMARQVDKLPVEWRGFAHDLGGLRRTVGADLVRVLAAIGRGLTAAAFWAARVASGARRSIVRPVPSASPHQPALETTNIADFDVSRRLRMLRPRSASAESEASAAGVEASARSADRPPALGQIIGGTWERSTPTLTKGPIDRARRRQMRMEPGAHPCANCGYIQSAYARFCNRCGERVERVD
ncbi:MAG TPA: zinc ribbon domain-containing protein, partial [Chloroflexota bacterium]|nr:zinc ribbon domain-containing protein [Chloroflexota bacterium]